MSRPEAQGWCPTAFHPMMSGDGMLLRVRPRRAAWAAWAAIKEPLRLATPEFPAHQS